jgi:type II secretion system protein N
MEKKPRWGRRLAIVAAVLVVLLVGIYFVATSSIFLKSVILPKVGKSMNATITVGDSSISPFSSVTLHDLKLTTTAPLVEAREVRLRYSLMDIIKGRINVSEVTIDSPVVTLVKEANGKSNLDPITNSSEKKTETKPSDKKTELDVHNVALKNATVRITDKTAGEITELSGLNVTLDQLKNGGSGKLTIASDLRLDKATNHLAAKISGAYEFALTAALAPQSVKGSTRIDLSRADGIFRDAGGMAAFLDADVSPTALNNVAFRFEKGAQQLGQLRVRGPFDSAKMEGSLTVELLALDRNVLNLAGMDFAQSKINSTNKVDISKAGKMVAIDGQVIGSQLAVVRENSPTPPVDLNLSYKVAADMDAKKAAVDRLLVSARHKNAEFLSATIDQPLNLNWGASSNLVKDSIFRLVITNLNLADWKAVLGTNPPTGVVNAGLRLQAQNDGKNLAVDFNTRVDQLTMGEMIRSNKVSLTGTAKYDLTKKDLGLQMNADLPAPDATTNRLAIGVNLDASMPGEKVDLRELGLKLTPTPRAKNELTIQAKLDMSKTNPAPGTITVKSTGLDLTKYYDMFTGTTKTNVAGQETVVTGPVKDPNVEPAPMDLPFKHLTANVAIDKLFLREVAISNWVATTVISNNNVRLNPLSLGLNGGPVSGDVALNLGVPGYGYNLNLKIDRVPIEPLANSFGSSTGKLSGFLIANAAIRGAGTTGAGLQKNLQGEANFSVTNMDLQIVGPKIKGVIAPIAFILRVPELMQTPINWIDARTQMGGGKIHVEKMGVESEAFYANVVGDITIDKILTNSPLNLPVELSLRRSLAQKAMLLSSDTPTNAKYAALPKFVTVKGTLGAPDSDINKMAIAGVLGRAAMGIGGNAIGGNAGAMLNVLTGQSSSTNASTNTTGKLIQGLGGLLGGAKPTNAVAGTNAPATNAPVQNLLNLFKKPK